MTLRRIRFWLSGVTLPLLLAAAPLAVSAQTPEPAAGNPAINTTPRASGGGSGTTSTMASPSNATNIPKGSNPDSGSGNLAAGSGATPSSQSSENSTPSQTASDPNASPDPTTLGPNAAGNGNSAMSDNTNGSNSGDGSMAQGKYASPPDLLPQSEQ